MRRCHPAGTCIHPTLHSSTPHSLLCDSCPTHFHREDSIQLVGLAGYFVGSLSVRTLQSVVFYVCGCCLLASLLVVSAILGIPPVMDGIWILAFLMLELPALSASLLASPVKD